MQQYILRRLVLFVPTMLLASLATFFIMRALPGDVALVILGGEANSPAALEQLETYREALGLRDPLPVQYGRWMWSLVNGEFGGRSLADREPISAILARRVPVTLQLAFYALVISLVISVPLGVIAAVHQDRWPDYAVRLVTLSGHALPNFWLALVLLLILSVQFSWSPPVYYKNLWEDPVLHLQKAIWPALVLAWGFSANITRITRSNMLEVLRQDFVRTARAKGLIEQVVVSKHALKNALIPVLTLSGLQLAGLLGGTVILESIFGMPGIGQGIVLAANTRDYPVIQTLAMLLVLFMLCLNLIVDLCYAAIDPRISYQ
ncbi:MAG: ABC transporter permease [Chloroflexota bacterium]